MNNFPKKRYSYGLDWESWNIGVQTIRVKEYGIVSRFSIFPFIFYLTIKKFK